MRKYVPPQVLQQSKDEKFSIQASTNQSLQHADIYRRTIVKFLNAANMLILSQQQKHNTSGDTYNQLYPLILQMGNQLIVHLGPMKNTLEILNQSQIYQVQAKGVAYFVREQMIFQQNMQGREHKNYDQRQELQQERKQIDNEQVHKVTKKYMANAAESLHKATDLEKEKERLHIRYRERQLGRVIRRIRKPKEKLIQEFIQGRDPKETKNIPKNYAKAIMTYILKNEDLISKLLPDETKRKEYMNYLQTMKLAIQNIKQFKAMLQDNVSDPKQKEYNKIFRIVSWYFLKNNAIAYIFHSRITQEAWHIKYRVDLMRAVQTPQCFKKVKLAKTTSLKE